MPSEYVLLPCLFCYFKNHINNNYNYSKFTYKNDLLIAIIMGSNNENNKSYSRYMK